MKVGSKQCALIAAVAAASPFLFNASSAQAQTALNSTWLPAGGGEWTTGTNWDSDPSTEPDAIPNYPNGVSAAVTFNFNGTFPAAETVTLGGAVTVGSISASNNTNRTFRIGGTNTLTFETNSGPATVNIGSTGTQPFQLNVPMVFNDDVVVDIVGTATGTAGHFLLGGTVTGTGGFTKTGPGRMTLANTPGLSAQFKDYTGATIIDNGRVRVSLDGVPRATSSFAIQNKGQIVPITSGNFSPGGANAATTVLSIAGSGPTDGPDANFKGAILPDANLAVTFDNPIFLSGGPAVIHSRGTTPANASITLNNVISGGGTLQLSPDAGDGQFGTYFIRNTGNTYTGGTIAHGGVIDATQGNLGATTAPLTVNAIAFGGAQTTVLLNTSSPTTVGTLSGNRQGNATTINNGGQLFTVNQTADGTYDGVITGAGGLALGSLSTNTLTLTGANTYAGDTTINAGTLAVAAESALGTSTNAIQLAGGNLQTNGPIAFTRNAAVTAGTGGINTNGFDSTIGTVTGAGGFTKSGVLGGKLTANQVKIGGALAVTGGALEVTANGGAAGMVEATALTITGAALRLNDNDLLINYTGGPSPEAQVRQYVKDGRLAASTTGIFSTPGNPDDDVVLAVADNTAWGKSSFNGVNIDADTVIGKYTYFGDANLDGKVTGDDYLNVDANLGTGDSWLEGDFNMSGVTTGDDYLAIDANLGKGTANPLAFAELKEEMVALHAAMFGDEYLVKLAAAEAEGFGASVVPEPAAISLIGVGAVGLLGRRRRRA